MFSISPITKGDLGYQFTITTDESFLSLDEANEFQEEIREVSTTYRTDSSGRGLWAWRDSGLINAETRKSAGVYEWKQVLGTSQFDLNRYKDRRGYLLMHFLDVPSEPYGDMGKAGSIREAREHYRYLKAKGLAK